MPSGSPASLSATFAFQNPGTYSVSATGTAWVQVTSTIATTTSFVINGTTQTSTKTQDLQEVTSYPLSAQQQLTVAPSGAPVLTPIGNQTVKAGTELYFWINIYAGDPRLLPLTFGVVNLPPGAICPSVTLGKQNGEPIWLGGDPEFHWAPTSSQVGTYTVTFTAKPADGTTVSETITITVTP